MLTKISERALVGALYLIGTKILGHPVSVPCRKCLADSDNVLQMENNGLLAQITLDQDDLLSVQLLRNDKATLELRLPYSVAACFVPSPVSFIEREL